MKKGHVLPHLMAETEQQQQQQQQPNILVLSKLG
jgi:hypothetical protein